jgi:hypothetical protein
LCDLHPFFDQCLAGQNHFELIASRDSIFGQAGPTNTPSAAAGTNKLIPDELHGPLYGQVFRNLVFSAKDINRKKFFPLNFHLYSPITKEASNGGQVALKNLYSRTFQRFAAQFSSILTRPKPERSLITHNPIKNLLGKGCKAHLTAYLIRNAWGYPY